MTAGWWHLTAGDVIAIAFTYALAVLGITFYRALMHMPEEYWPDEEDSDPEAEE